MYNLAKHKLITDLNYFSNLIKSFPHGMIEMPQQIQQNSKVHFDMLNIAFGLYVMSPINILLCIWINESLHVMLTFQRSRISIGTY